MTVLQAWAPAVQGLDQNAMADMSFLEIPCRTGMLPLVQFFYGTAAQAHWRKWLQERSWRTEEFDSDPDQVVAELKDIPEYVHLFDAALKDGADAITYANISRAITAFQRTLLSMNSPYDRFAAGNFEAFTPQQRRGLALFRSARTRCNDRHSAPTFSDDGFSVTGVPPLPGTEYDPGRAEVDPQGGYRAFKAPTLRNIPPQRLTCTMVFLQPWKK